MMNMAPTDCEMALQQVRERRLLLDQVDRWLLEEISPFLGQRVLEVGCGLGNLTAHLLDRELVVGIDVSAESVRQLQTQYSSYANFQAVVGDITDSQILELGRFAFDTVLSLNVLEHIADDELALQNMAQLLQPGGRLILIVPAHDRLYGSMDRAIGHYRRYSIQTMERHFETVHFRMVYRKYINALGALGWLINGRLLGQNVPPVGQLRLLNAVVAVEKWIERKVPAPFGTSLLAIAEKAEHLSC
jgi:SAM-dependent methyltransferase